jgi:pimeloyl-ACP methyl ester carboxylesterase
VRYIEAGTAHDGLPLVLLHGYRAGADLWLPFTLPGLSTEHRVIAPDLPGFGYSGPLSHYDLPAYADALRSFLDALNIEQINLLGHSMGGQIAIALAAAYPDRVNALVLADSAGMPRVEPRWLVPFKMLADSSLRHWRLYPSLMRLGVRASAGREGLKLLQAAHVHGYLKSLTMPVLVIWGSRDRVVPLEHGALLVRAIPNARLAVVRGAGHMPYYQKPHEFNRIVLSFLRRHTAELPT